MKDTKELIQAVYQIQLEHEKEPASEQQTKVCLMLEALKGDLQDIQDFDDQLTKDLARPMTPAEDALIAKSWERYKKTAEVLHRNKERDRLKAVLDGSDALHTHILRNLSQEKIDHLLGQWAQELRAENERLKAERLRGKES